MNIYGDNNSRRSDSPLLSKIIWYRNAWNPQLKTPIPCDEQDSNCNSTPTIRKSPTWRQFKDSRVSPEKKKEKKKRLWKPSKQPRRRHETTVSMVPTPRSHVTAPHAPDYRAQSSSLTLLRPSRPLPQQDSKMVHVDDDMLEEQKKLLLSRASAETRPIGII